MFELCKEIKPQETEKLQGYATELKYDGVRNLFFIVNGKLTKLHNREDINRIDRFKHLTQADFENHTLVLDGEIVVFNEQGRTDLVLLNTKVNWHKAVAVIWDILFKDGEDLRNKPYSERKAILESLKLGKGFMLAEAGQFKTLWEKVKLNNLEGVILKPINSIYSGGRNCWQKCKNWQEQEVTFKHYEDTKAGIVLVNPDIPLRVACNGQQSEAVKQALQQQGQVRAEIQFLEKMATGSWRMATFKKMATTNGAKVGKILKLKNY